MLAAAALFWASSDHASLTDRFHHARKVIRKIFRGQREPGRTYRGFMKLLRKWHQELLRVVVGELRLRMEQKLPDHYRIAGYAMFGGDGSRVELPRTKSNPRGLCAAAKRQTQEGEIEARPETKTPNHSSAGPGRNRQPRQWRRKRI